VRVTSLAYRTDLALLELGGSTVEDRGDHLVVRSPHNPSFYWGNFLLVEGPPAAGAAGHWVEVFRDSFPDAGHVAIGVDGTTGTRADLAGFADLGLDVAVDSVMTAERVHEPPHPNHEATYRTLETDQDWADLVDFRVATEGKDDSATYRRFVTDRAAASRTLAQAGHGAWFGAFLDGRLVSSMGLMGAGDGLVRFQDVETLPAARGRGLAGTLVHAVSRYGFGELGARTLVMVADPDYTAIRIYRALGFTSSQTQLGVQRAPLDP
jgi:ribosomal protein S18 acetylase RimI-like enzyme